MSVDLFQVIRTLGKAAVDTLVAAPDLSIRNMAGETLLHEAIASNNMPAFECLLRAGLDANAADSIGQTPLHFAAAYQNCHAAKHILVQGGDVGLRDRYGNTALWSAVFNAKGKYGVVALLLENGAGRQAEAENMRGKSPLGFARLVGDQEMIRMLEAAIANDDILD
jgi:ankyrin repeat protein